MEKTLHLVVAIYGEPTKPSPVMDAVNREIEILKTRRTWWQRILEAF